MTKRLILLILLAAAAVAAYVYREPVVAWVEQLPGAWKAHQAEQRATEVQRYQLQVIEELGKRDSARELAVAAVQAHLSEGGIARRRADPLFQQALDKAGDDVLIHWIAAADCPGSPAVCRPDKALARLEKLAAENAAVWLLAAQAAAQAKDDKAVRNALARAARAERYDDMSQELLGAVLATYRSLKIAPPREDDSPRGGADTAYVVPALDLALGAAVPPHQALLERCRKERVAKDDTARADCLAYFQLLERTSTSAVGYEVGLKGQLQLAGEGEEADTLKEKLRNWKWQSSKLGELSVDDFDDLRTLETYLENWRDRGELGALRGRLLEHNITLDAPADWTPQKEEPKPEE
jgi:hypothetical protein